MIDLCDREPKNKSDALIGHHQESRNKSDCPNWYDLNCVPIFRLVNTSKCS